MSSATQSWILGSRRLPIDGSLVNRRLNTEERALAVKHGVLQRAVVALGTCLGPLLYVQTAGAAEATPINLVWDAPRYCPQQSEIVTRIQKLIGAPQGREPVNALDARGVIEPYKDEFQLTLSIRDGTTTGTRSIASTSCRSLGEAAAVVLGLLIRQKRVLGRSLSNQELGGSPSTSSDPNGTPSSTEPPSRGSTELTRGDSGAPPQGEAGNTPSATEPTETKQARDPRAPPNKALPHDAPTKNSGGEKAATETQEPKWSAFAAAPMLHLEYGTLPSLSPGVGISLGLTNGTWYAFATAALFAHQTSRQASIRDYEVTFRNRSLDGWICRAWEWKPLRLATCGLLATNFVTTSASGKGISSQSPTATWVSVGAGVKPSVHLTSRMAIAARVIGRVALNRPEFLFVDSLWGEEQIRRAPQAALELSLGPEWFF